MAARRVRYSRSGNLERFGPEVEYGGFIADLLSGRVTATRLYDGQAANGHPQFDYDDPTGVGPRASGQRSG